MSVLHKIPYNRIESFSYSGVCPPMPTIKRITVLPYNLPLKSPLQWGKGHIMKTLEHVLVRVELSDGVFGLAEANPRPTIYGETPESVEAIIRRHIAPELINKPVDSVASIAYLMERLRLLKGNNTALSAVNMALWHALAKSRSMPIAELIGVEQDAVYVSYILGIDETEAALREIETVYNAGVRVLKLKVGKHFDKEMGLLREINEAYPEIEVYIDANEGYNIDNVLDILGGFAQLGARYVEEPLNVRRLWERANLREISPLLIIADDSAFTYADLERELTFDTFDILNIKPARTGYTQSLALSVLAQAAEKGVMFGSQASSILGCIHTLLLAASQGFEYPAEATFFLKIADSPTLPIHDGKIRMIDVEKALRTELPELPESPHVYWNMPDLAPQVEKAAARRTVEILSRLALDSHTPLNAVIGYADIVRDTLISNDNSARELLRYLNIMSTSGERLLNQISVALTVAQIHADAYPVQFEKRVSLKVMLHDILDTLERKAVNTQRHINYHPANGLFDIQADPRKLQLALSLLIQQTIDRTNEDGSITITLANHLEKPDHVQITIEDDGNYVPVVEPVGTAPPPERMIIEYVLKKHRCTHAITSSQQGTHIVMIIPAHQSSIAPQHTIYRDHMERIDTDDVLDIATAIQAPLMELKAHVDLLHQLTATNGTAPTTSDDHDLNRVRSEIEVIHLATDTLNAYVEPALQTAYIQTYRNYILRQELTDYVNFYQHVLASLSHDLRPPLGTVSGYIEMLLWEFEQGDTSHTVEYLREMEKVSDNLLRVVDDMLKNARAQGLH